MMNPLLEEIYETFPGISIALPTAGRYYPPEMFPEGTSPADIHIGVLSMVDEQKYRDPFLLGTGKAIPQLLKHVAPEILIPEILTEVDVETILLATRLASYGPKMSLRHYCTNPASNEAVVVAEDGTQTKLSTPVCQAENPISIDLQEFILRYEVIPDDELFQVKLPRVGQSVRMMPPSYRSVHEMIRHALKNRSITDKLSSVPLEDSMNDFFVDEDNIVRYESLVTMSTEIAMRALCDSIFSVVTRSGKTVTDGDAILEWLYNLPIQDVQVLNDALVAISEKLRSLSKVEYDCPECGHHNTFHLQMNPETLFFSDAGDSPAAVTSSNTSEPNKLRTKKPSRVLRR